MEKIFVLFDADGTLLDSMGYHRALAAECIVRYFSNGTGVGTERALKAYDETAEVPFPRQLDIIFPGEGLRKAREACVREYGLRKLDHVYRKAGIFSDAVPGIIQLSDLGITPTVSADTEGGIVGRFLSRNGIRTIFEAVRGVESGPKASHIEEVRREYSPGRMFFVGDSVHDMGLHRHGVVTIGRYGDGPGMRTREELLDAGASFVTCDFRELPDFIK